MVFTLGAPGEVRKTLINKNSNPEGVEEMLKFPLSHFSGLLSALVTNWYLTPSGIQFGIASFG